MNRRSFLSLLTGTASALMLDPERVLWVPGTKAISIPSPHVVSDYDVIMVMQEILRPEMEIIFMSRSTMWEKYFGTVKTYHPPRFTCLPS